MDDELLPRAPTLIGVMSAGIDECLLQTFAVDRNRGLVGVLLDDREQVAEQTLLGLGELCMRSDSRRRRVIELIDRRSRSRNQRGRETIGSPGAIGTVLTPRTAQPPAGRFALLLRNSRPSSCLLA